MALLLNTTPSETLRTTKNTEFTVHVLPSPSRDSRATACSEILTVTEDAEWLEVQAETEIECYDDDTELNGIDSLVLTFAVWNGQTDIRVEDITVTASFTKFTKVHEVKLNTVYGDPRPLAEYMRVNAWVMQVINNVIWTYNRK
jgi:hypothetical protein